MNIEKITLFDEFLIITNKKLQNKNLLMLSLSFSSMNSYNMQITRHKKYRFHHENLKNCIIYRILTLFLLFNYLKISNCFDITDGNQIASNNKETNVNIKENKYYDDRIVFKASKQLEVDDENEYLTDNLEADATQGKLNKIFTFLILIKTYLIFIYLLKRCKVIK